MDIDDLNKKPKAAEEWTIVGKKPKPPSAVKDATQTPLPASPNRINTNATQLDPTDSDQLQPPITYVQLNDGPLRITAKWKPTPQYDTLSEDQPVRKCMSSENEI